MKKRETGLKAWGKLIQATLFLQHDPLKLCLCLPKRHWKAHSWFGQMHPRPAYYCADKNKNKASTNKSSTDTHIREGGCTDFSIFFPFFTFRRDNIAAIDWNEAIFTCRFWKSNLCQCDFLKSNYESNQEVSNSKFFDLTLIAVASARLRFGPSCGNAYTWTIHQSGVQLYNSRIVLLWKSHPSQQIQMLEQ